ncbi:ComEC/Rec2 family competence protein [Xanthobacter pseudotagetidis]|uniref:ComEC/Rec2 family competence protein n=1 Tax=Xanthobacter pseudotagetidis TaxID=3119911 RepID=UPI00372783FF
MGQGMEAGRRRAGGRTAAAGAVLPLPGESVLRPAPGRAGALVDALGARIAGDAAAEMRSGRLILWLPAAFAAGILLYFGADQEPSLVASGVLVAALAAGAAAARARPLLLALLLALLAVAAGFSVAGLRTALIAHGVTAPPSFPVRLAGHVERVERRAKGDRILLRLDGRPARGLDRPPDLVRLTLRKGWAPAVGTPVTQLAQLLPPLGPAMPGAHDFGRGPWFDGIGAVGYGLGRPKPAPDIGPPPPSVRFATAVDAMRQDLSARIRAVIGGTPAEIAVALVAGDRSAIPERVEEGMRVSGLTHILSISGLHMALVMGTLFAAARALLALVPPLALSWPIKSMAAAVALAGGAFYLVLSGNDVPAQRSFVMAALVLAGVAAGRPALTLRTVAVAAVLVLALSPEAALEPGTQMSFAATLALVAAYEQLRPLRALPRAEGWVTRAAIMLCVFFAGIALTSLVAGLATAPYGAFHFQRLAPYGLLANLAAMPAVSLVVMPAGLAGVLLLPLGWDSLAWPVMGFGIEIMLAASDWVAALPGADQRVGVMGAASLSCVSLALLCLCLLRGALRALALAPLALAVIVAPAPFRPEILIAPNGETVAVRAADGRLSVIGARAHRLIAEQWLTREGDRRSADDPALAAAFACDPTGCVAPLPSGGAIAVSRRAEGLAADCLTARIVVTRDAAPHACPARVITPAILERTGTLAFLPQAGADAARAGTDWHEEGRRPEIRRGGAIPDPEISEAGMDTAAHGMRSADRDQTGEALPAGEEAGGPDSPVPDRQARSPAQDGPPQDGLNPPSSASEQHPGRRAPAARDDLNRPVPVPEPETAPMIAPLQQRGPLAWVALKAVPTRPASLHRPWMPVLPALSQEDAADDLDLEALAADAADPR